MSTYQGTRRHRQRQRIKDAIKLFLTVTFGIIPSMKSVRVHTK
jgi:hypothetical protein